jgi:PqqD family protein of HPr-rel-A system
MRIETPAHVVFESLGENTVLLNLNSGNYFELNPTAARIWALIQDHQDTEEIVAAMCKEFDADPETLSKDLSSLLEELGNRGLIQRVGSE